MEFFRIHRTIPFMRHALILNLISLLTFIAAVFFIATRGFHLSIEFTGGTVMERTKDVPEGMKVLYALLDQPAALIQDAAAPHEGYDLPAGFYEFRIAREYDPFAEQARQVAD